MKPRNYNSIKIDIKLKNGDKSKNKDVHLKKEMCDLCGTRNRRICTLCLNETDFDDKVNSKKSLKYCNVCNNPLTYFVKDSDPKTDPCSSKNCERETNDTIEKKNALIKNNTANIPNKNHSKAKNGEKFDVTNAEIQKNESLVTNEPVDISQGLNLLTEVLNVFQSKKIIDKSNDFQESKKLKDAAVNTEEQSNIYRNKLSRSKVVKYSIQEENRLCPSSNFVILEARQPEFVKSQFCLNLKRGKSSSIPQMKLEELKQSLKEKTKSKDAVEEVNRMFATVRRTNDNSEDSIGSNRPMVRSGPRVLPVVKTGSKILMAPKEMRDNGCTVSPRASTRCQHCQTGLSAGDSKHCKKCRCVDVIRCEKCTYMLSQSHGQKGIMMCEGIGRSSCQCRDVTIWNTNDS